MVSPRVNEKSTKKFFTSSAPLKKLRKRSDAEISLCSLRGRLARVALKKCLIPTKKVLAF